MRIHGKPLVKIPTGLKATWDAENHAVRLSWDTYEDKQNVNFGYYLLYRRIDGLESIDFVSKTWGDHFADIPVEQLRGSKLYYSMSAIGCDYFYETDLSQEVMVETAK